MKYLKALGVFTILAALLLLPQAMAVKSSFGTSYASSKYELDLGIDSSFNSIDAIRDGTSLNGVLKVDLNEGEQFTRYHEVVSLDGKATAATYAYVNGPGSSDL